MPSFSVIAKGLGGKILIIKVAGWDGGLLNSLSLANMFNQGFSVHPLVDFFFIAE